MLAAYGVLFTVGLYMPNVWLLAAVPRPGGRCSPATVFAITASITASVVPYRLRGFAYAIVGHLPGVRRRAARRRPHRRPVRRARRAHGHHHRDAGRLRPRRPGDGVRSAARQARHGAGRRGAGRGARAKRRGTEHDELLQIRNLDFSYGPVQVLFDVDLDVHEGRGARPARHQRRRQVDPPARHLRPRPARARRRPLPGPHHHLHRRHRPGAPRHRAGARRQGGLPEPDRAREPARRRPHLHLGRRSGWRPSRRRCSTCSRGCSSGSTSRRAPSPAASSRCWHWPRPCCSTPSCC